MEFKFKKTREGFGVFVVDGMCRVGRVKKVDHGKATDNDFRSGVLWAWKLDADKGLRKQETHFNTGFGTRAGAAEEMVAEWEFRGQQGLWN